MKRTIVTAATVTVVLALSACTPGPTATAEPSALPTASPLPTASATPSVAPSPASTGLTTQPTPQPTPPKRTVTAEPTTQATPEASTDIPGDLGTTPEGFTLPEEDRPGDEEVTAFTTSVWRAVCPDKALALEAASGLEATRIKESLGPEHSVTNGLMVFTDDAAAQAFMTELGTELKGCVPEGPDEDGWRTVQQTRDLADLGEEALAVGSWSQWNTGDAWVDAPGGGMEYLARQGRYVVLASEGGEYVGDPAALPQLGTDLSARVTQMLGQL